MSIIRANTDKNHTSGQYSDMSVSVDKDQIIAISCLTSIISAASPIEEICFKTQLLIPMRLITPNQYLSDSVQIEKLASTIVWLYNYQLVSFDTVKEYLEEIMLDDNDGVARLLYFEYLRKITETALLLSRKIEGQNTANDICFYQ